MVPPLCAVCSRHLTNQPASVERPWQCALCFGILDPDFIAEVAEKVHQIFLGFVIFDEVLQSSFLL